LPCHQPKYKEVTHYETARTSTPARKIHTGLADRHPDDMDRHADRL